MIINGQVILTEEELEQVILPMNDESKNSLRKIFHGNTSQQQLTTKELDYMKYIKRAAVKDQIIAEMASENMERVRAGTWTVPDLIGLTQDQDLKLVLDDINTLSFELAQSKLNNATNPLLTPEIKMTWILKLQSHLYNS